MTARPNETPSTGRRSPVDPQRSVPQQKKTIKNRNAPTKTPPGTDPHRRGAKETASRDSPSSGLGDQESLRSSILLTPSSDRIKRRATAQQKGSDQNERTLGPDRFRSYYQRWQQGQQANGARKKWRQLKTTRGRSQAFLGTARIPRSRTQFRTRKRA